MSKVARATPHLLVWTRAILPDPTTNHPPPILVDNITWVFGAAGEEGVLSGRVYGDGSGLYNDSPIQRCGWGVVSLRQSAAGSWTVVAGCYVPSSCDKLPAKLAKDATGSITCVVCDITKDDSVAGAVAAALARRDGPRRVDPDYRIPPPTAQP